MPGFVWGERGLNDASNREQGNFIVKIVMKLPVFWLLVNYCIRGCVVNERGGRLSMRQ